MDLSGGQQRRVIFAEPVDLAEDEEEGSQLEGGENVEGEDSDIFEDIP